MMIEASKKANGQAQAGRTGRADRQGRHRHTERKVQSTGKPNGNIERFTWLTYLGCRHFISGILSATAPEKALYDL